MRITAYGRLEAGRHLSVPRRRFWSRRRVSRGAWHAERPDDLADITAWFTRSSRRPQSGNSGPSGRVQYGSGTSCSDFGESLDAALEGNGIAMHPYYMVQDDLDTGRLIAVLPEYRPESHDIHVIWSNRHSLPERARRFVDFLREEFSAPPPWAQPR